MRFKPYEPGRPYRPRTPAQDRQLRVFRLRGLYYHSYALSGWRSRLFRWLIDQELAVYGAEPQSTRDRRRFADASIEPDFSDPF